MVCDACLNGVLLKPIRFIERFRALDTLPLVFQTASFCVFAFRSWLIRQQIVGILGNRDSEPLCESDIADYNPSPPTIEGWWESINPVTGVVAYIRLLKA